MESQPMFLDCPAYLDEQGLIRCGLPAEVKRRFIMKSTGGPLESVMITCPAGHIFHAPIEFLTLENHPGTVRLPGTPHTGGVAAETPDLRIRTGIPRPPR